MGSTTQPREPCKRPGGSRSSAGIATTTWFPWAARLRSAKPARRPDLLPSTWPIGQSSAYFILPAASYRTTLATAHPEATERGTARAPTVGLIRLGGVQHAGLGRASLQLLL